MQFSPSFSQCDITSHKKRFLIYLWSLLFAWKVFKSFTMQFKVSLYLHVFLFSFEFFSSSSFNITISLLFHRVVLWQREPSWLHITCQRTCKTWWFFNKTEFRLWVRQCWKSFWILHWGKCQIKVHHFITTIYRHWI